MQASRELAVPLPGREMARGTAIGGEFASGGRRDILDLLLRIRRLSAGDSRGVLRESWRYGCNNGSTAFPHPVVPAADPTMRRHNPCSSECSSCPKHRITSRPFQRII